MYAQGYTYQTNTYPHEGLFFSTSSHEEEESGNEYLTDVHRYGFQGQESDDEVRNSTGTSLNYRYRMYDPRVSRFFALDPEAKKYPANGPYNFSENRVIDGIELEGREHLWFAVAMDEATGGPKLELVEAQAIPSMTLMNGSKVTFNVKAESFMKGSDGSWHRVPEAWSNHSISIMGSYKRAMNTINSWENADDVATGLAYTKLLTRVGETAEAAVGVVMLAKGVQDIAKGFTAKTSTSTGSAVDDASKLHAPGDLPNSTPVVRGGLNKAEQFENGTGVMKAADGTLSGVSVNSQQGSTIKKLTEGIPNNKVGVTTVGEVRAVGGNVKPSPTKNNPTHATMEGVTGKQASELTNPVIPNPSKQK